ncbi:MAG: excinuclease ABC subunit UvrA [Acidobacteriia bacterium]|nr:excinuclease ABC subunit UvrA [Terriglobia bacterium]
MPIENITVRGARQHNLKNLDVTIPRNTFTVITGLSGSGKSSLAFDTIYAEGQRRYVESLSTYARQFLDQMERPDIDSIEGLSPSISIEQKTSSRSPRSTVGTITEIYDYLRVLYATVGIPHCPQCGRRISRQSSDQIVSTIMSMPSEERVMVLAPIVRGRKGEFKKQLEELNRSGFVRARIDGQLHNLEDPVRLDKKKNHTVEIVVDRLLIKPGIDSRLRQSIETAMRLTGGIVQIAVVNGEEHLYSEKLACVDCGLNLPQLEPRSFSFNSMYGACETCNGLGSIFDFDPSKIVTDWTKPIFGGALAGWAESRRLEDSFLEMAQAKSFSPETPFGELSERIQAAVLYGENHNHPSNGNPGSKTRRARRVNGRQPFMGIIPHLKDSFGHVSTEWLLPYMSSIPCNTCKGRRLKPESLAVQVGGHSIAELTSLPTQQAREVLNDLKLTPREEIIAQGLLKEVRDRLDFLSAVGLDYLSLDRSAATLSGGEGQRIRLASQIGSKLRGVLYVLDEPSIGLHPRDNLRLINTLKQLRDLGNTVLVVEHDEETIRNSDHVIDLGPGAGTHGGFLVAAGTPDEISNTAASLTGQYLAGLQRIPLPKTRRKPNGKSIKIVGARHHNLKNLDVEIPIGLMTVITGVSGAGKSTLINDVLYKTLARRLYHSIEEAGAVKAIIGLEHIDKVITIDASPIGRTPRSNPATYTGLFTPIRQLYALLPESRERGYKAGRFSFNVKGGRCEACQGDGLRRIEMNFLPDVFVTCDVCRGQRYNHETLAVKFKGRSISDLLNTTVTDAIPLLEKIPQIAQKLTTLNDVGLGYLQLGQSATTLSGGEAQRIKLARELSRRQTGRTLYILDEPTTGLHFDDVKKLLAVLNRLTDLGNTVIIIEHHLDVIKTADWIIDLGPEGGEKGGRIVAAGVPEHIARVQRSYTGQALAELFSNGNHAVPVEEARAAETAAPYNKGASS